MVVARSILFQLGQALLYDKTKQTHSTNAHFLPSSAISLTYYSYISFSPAGQIPRPLLMFEKLKTEGRYECDRSSCSLAHRTLSVVYRTRVICWSSVVCQMPAWFFVILLNLLRKHCRCEEERNSHESKAEK